MNKVVIFNSNPETPITVSSWGIQEHLIMLGDENLAWDLSGFKLYEEDGKTLIRNYSEYTHQWNVYTSSDTQVYLTDLENYTEPNPDIIESIEVVTQLSNQELTECVAELMCTVSMSQLGL